MNNIILVYGGNSVEHEISVITALQIKKKYKGKYNLNLCYLKNGIFYFGKKLESLETYKDFKKHSKHLKKINFMANNNNLKVGFRKIPFDAVWVVTHGHECEDGTINAHFKTLNINVISEDIYSGVLGQDKVFSKILCKVKTLPYFQLYKKEYINNQNDVLEQAKKISFPLIIKPSKLGSSIGVCKVENQSDLLKKLEESFYLCDCIICERYLENFEEYNIAAIEINNKIILSEIEKVSNNKMLTYDDKYINNNKSMLGQKRELPAIISNKLKEKIEQYAQKIYNNLNCKYIVRMDFLYDKNNNILYFNEINNIPGSLALYLFEKKNINTNKLIDSYIDEGLKNIDFNKNILKNFKNNIFKELSLNSEKIYK